MRRKILHKGAEELRYEIREIVKVATQFENFGIDVCWENIGDPVQKGVKLPDWMKQIVSQIAMQSSSYAYSPTKGIAETRAYLAAKTNARGGVQISANDILFCNGLGDAISKVYTYLDEGARVIGPSPAYSTHSSAEGGHAGQPPLTYLLDPENNWLPNLEDLRNKVKYNPSVVGILIINPDNPTGMVYPLDYLKKFVKLAQQYNLFLLADEIYTNITYNSVNAIQLCEVIGDVCGIAMKGISKEFPWPGARCGWLEFYNTNRDPEFAGLVRAVENAKMLEVCSTTLPQLAIPKIMEHPHYQSHREKLNTDIEIRGDVVLEALQDIPQITINKTYGSFYNTIVFKSGSLKPGQKLQVKNSRAKELVEKLVRNVEPDRRFVYYLMAATGICVVPISAFCSDLMGFRVTLLEGDPQKMKWIYQRLREAIQEYLASA